ncbi:MAG: hypothetical protein EOP11_19230 [Proteobacteria bacterium]|nr:MAG: hypothetical protein EOP11_19230 [Pseudomonadota bacterium]
MKRTLVLVWDYPCPERKSIQRLLKSPHFDVIAFTRGEDAINYLREANRKPSAIVLPDSVPAAQRLGFLRHFREQAPALFFEIPVLLITSSGAFPEIYPLKRRLGFEQEAFRQMGAMAGLQ